MSQLKVSLEGDDKLSINSDFDWTGDGTGNFLSDDESVDYKETSTDPTFFKEEEGRKEEKEGHSTDNTHFYISIISSSWFHNAAAILILIRSAFVFIAVKDNILSMMEVHGVSLEKWINVSIMKMLFPIWFMHILLRISEWVSCSSRLSKTDLSTFLYSILPSATFTLSNIALGLYWMSNFPLSCVDLSQNSTDQFCFYDHVPHLFIFFIISGLISIIGLLLMKLLRHSFQKRSFRDRLRINRYNMNLVQRLIQKSGIIKGEMGGGVGHMSTGQIKEKVFKSMSFKYSWFIPALLFIKLPLWLFDLIIGMFITSSASNKNILNKDSVSTAESTTVLSTCKTEDNVKALARMLFHSLASGKDHLVIDDFRHFCPDQRITSESYLLFDADKDGSVTKDEMKLTLLRLYREHYNLAQSIANTGTVLGVLDQLSYAIMGGLFLLIFMGVVLKLNVGSMLGFVASFALALNFVIADAANKTFQSILMLFVVHPFDVGDKLVIGKEVGYSQDDILTIVAINIQNTVLSHWNGDRITMPNHLLAASPINNLSRKTQQWERFALKLPCADSTQEMIDCIEVRLTAFVKEYRALFYPNIEVRVLSAADVGQMETDTNEFRLVIKVQCHETQNVKKRNSRHVLFVNFVKNELCKDLL